ncbi:hypothetical protein D7Z94_15785 [Ulvibacterium marinum]|uniref:Uncharacterized protein n=1 Tax=Ulvibacterium marinum TaxID=2419782 RepID=A0A3B0C4X3_9FLAO|nr:hypothetical protein D7Z94_15785 [Ulvibacterium marinum]
MACLGDSGFQEFFYLRLATAIRFAPSLRKGKVTSQQKSGRRKGWKIVFKLTPSHGQEIKIDIF